MTIPFPLPSPPLTPDSEEAEHTHTNTRRRSDPPYALASYLSISRPLVPIPSNISPTLPLTPLHQGDVSRTRRNGHVVASLSGYTEDWDSLETMCRMIAEDQIFRSLLREPGTAGVCVGSTVMLVHAHGELKVFQEFEAWICIYEHGHRERDDQGRERHWQGTRRYTYTAVVETTMV